MLVQLAMVKYPLSAKLKSGDTLPLNAKLKSGDTLPLNAKLKLGSRSLNAGKKWRKPLFFYLGKENLCGFTQYQTST